MEPDQPEEYIYPTRHELLEDTSDKLRVVFDLAHVSPAGRQSFMAELTTMTLAP